MFGVGNLRVRQKVSFLSSCWTVMIVKFNTLLLVFAHGWVYDTLLVNGCYQNLVEQSGKQRGTLAKKFAVWPSINCFIRDFSMITYFNMPNKNKIMAVNLKFRIMKFIFILLFKLLVLLLRNPGQCLVLEIWESGKKWVSYLPCWTVLIVKFNTLLLVFAHGWVYDTRMGYPCYSCKGAHALRKV